jgi:uncharacterized protein YecE (DUF72 family)
MMTQPPRIGTAGWSVPSIYLDKVPPGGSHLERYARHLNAVEINSSFHRPHRSSTYQRWAQATPDDFRFSVKLPKTISHDAGLIDYGASLGRFIEEIDGLGKKLGVLLIQLPPKSIFNADITHRFLNDLRARTGTAVALEPRHASWFTDEVGEWLTDRRVARVAADPARVPGAEYPGGWKGLAYYRWHGSPRMYYSDYDNAALSWLQDKLMENARSGAPTWCIFDNTTAGAALGNALDLAQLCVLDP